jgi:hypothetical protein
MPCLPLVMRGKTHTRTFSIRVAGVSQDLVNFLERLRLAHSVVAHHERSHKDAHRNY